jgi:hypothetical protein
LAQIQFVCADYFYEHVVRVRFFEEAVSCAMDQLWQVADADRTVVACSVFAARDQFAVPENADLRGHHRLATFELLIQFMLTPFLVFEQL